MHINEGRSRNTDEFRPRPNVVNSLKGAIFTNFDTHFEVSCQVFCGRKSDGETKKTRNRVVMSCLSEDVNFGCTCNSMNAGSVFVGHLDFLIERSEDTTGCYFCPRLKAPTPKIAEWVPHTTCQDVE